MKNFTKLSLFTFLLAAILFTACKKEYDSAQTVDNAAISDYIQKNNLSSSMIPDPDKTGFYYQVLTPGTGELFKNSDSVLYNVSIKSLASGSVYLTTSSNGNWGTRVGYTNSLPLTSQTTVIPQIPAIRTAINSLKPGGTARILLPSYLAFGKNGFSDVGIGSNDNLDISITTSTFRKQFELDDNRITTFLTSKGLTASAVKDPSRIYYIINTLGTGAAITGKESTVNVKYTVRTLDGTVYDSSTDGTFSTILTGVIDGWGIIIPKFPVGTKMRIFIPSDLAYGSRGSGSIPVNAVLDFDIEVTAVTN